MGSYNVEPNSPKSSLSRNSINISESMYSDEGLLEEQGTKDDEQTRSSWKSLFAFCTKKQVFVLNCAGLASIASGTIDPISAIFLGRIFQAFTDFGGGSITANVLEDAVKTNVLVLVGIGTASWLLNAAFLVLWVLFGELQAKSARALLFDGLLAKSAKFYDTRHGGVGSMTPRLQTYIKELQLATSQPLGYILSAVSSVIASLIIALKYEWSLTLILLSTMPINALVLNFISSRMQKTIQNQVGSLAVAAKNAANAFAAIETVKCYNGQDVEFAKYATAIRRAAASYIRQVYGNALQIGYMKCTTLLTFMIGFWYGSHLVVSGRNTTANIITTFFSCLEVTNAIQTILPQMIVMEKGRFAGQSLKDLLRVETLPSEPVEERKPFECRGQICFQHVYFAYPSRPEQLVFRDLSCSFGAGGITFVLGESGCGKSTLAQLLLRFYHPSLGQIYIDGNPITALDTSWVRNQITVVEQEPVLFEGTIKDNIEAGCSQSRSISLQHVKDAAEFALLRSAVEEFKNEFDTNLGTKGQSLSGGQRQKVALARARLRDTPVLLLDESTSALDQISRSLIVAAIRKWRKNKTTIFISHDTSLIDDGDRVYLFQNGSAIDYGTLSSLNGKAGPPLPAHAPVEPLAYEEEISSAQSELRDIIPSKSLPLRTTPSPVSYGRKRQISAKSLVLATQDHYILDPGPLPSTFTRKRTTTNTQQFPPSRSSKLRTDRISDLNNIELNILETAGASAIGRRLEINQIVRSEPTRRVQPVDNSATPNVAEMTAEHPTNVGKSVKQAASLRGILRTIWPSLHARPRKVLVIAFSCTVVHAACIPLFSWIFSNLVSTFYMAEGAAQEALKWSLIILGLSFIDGSACFGMHVAFEYCGQVWVDHHRLQAMKRILDQPRDFFADELNSSSHLAYSLDRNAEEMRNILGRFVAFVSVAVILMVITITWCLVVCWKLTLAGIALTPLSWGINRLFQVASERLESRSNNAGEAAAAVLNEAFTNIKIVWALTLESNFRKKHKIAIHDAFLTGVKRALVCGFFFGISHAIMIFNYSLIFYFGAELAASKVYTVHDVLLVFSQLMFALTNVTNIMSIIPQMSSSKDTAMRLMNLSNLPQDSHEHIGVLQPTEIEGVNFQNVSFSYRSRPSEIVLSNLSVDFPKGAITAIVGTSGSGKSTIASLLLKLYPPIQDPHSSVASLTLGGCDIQSIFTPILRSLVAVVPQTPILFPTTVSKNIAYGLSQGSKYNNVQSIRAAAIAAGIDEFLSSLPDGYDTLIGDGGLGLSGGQTQRVAIARALIRQPSILILDEATSALDAANANLVRETVTKLIDEDPRMTIIVITHSTDMMRVADRIVVLDRGRMVEEGTFTQLTKARGTFESLLSSGKWLGKETLE